MDPTEARRQSEPPFSRRSAARTNVNEYEARSREVQRKIEYLRQLRLAVQARRAQDLSTADKRRIFDRGVPDADQTLARRAER